MELDTNKIPEIDWSEPVINKPVLPKPKQIFQEIQNREYKRLIDEITDDKPSLLECIWYVITKAPALIYNLTKLLKLMEELKMDGDKKTTWVATIKVILGIVALLLGLFGKTLPPEVTEAIIAVAGGGFLVFSWIQGFFTNKKT
jgi:hypothetical protein